MRRFLVPICLVVVFLHFIVVLVIGLNIYPRVSRMQKSSVNAIVTEKQFKDSSLDLLPSSVIAGVPVLSEDHPAHYLVTVAYNKDLTQTFDDESLFESVKEGDIIEVELYQGYDNKNNLVTQELKLVK